MSDCSSSFTIINQNPLDMAVSRNLEGLELAKKKKVVERNNRRNNRQTNTVFNYLKNKLPHGNVDLELVNSLLEKEFNRFLTRARFKRYFNLACVISWFLLLFSGNIIGFKLAFFDKITIGEPILATSFVALVLSYWVTEEI